MVLGEVTLPNEPLITVTDPAKHVGSVFDGAGQMRLTVVSVAEAKDGGVVVQLLLQSPAPWMVGARRGWNPGGIWPEAPRGLNATPAAQCFDATGKLLPATTNGSYTDSSDDGQTMLQHLTLALRKDAGALAKIVVTGARPMVVAVPFVMENVPLP
jgi:hypothetical protein